MELIVTPTYESMSRVAADRIAELVRANPACTLGLATGSTPEGLYADLVADCATIEDIRRAVAAGADLVSTTLSHGVAALDCTMADGPDLPLLRQAVAEFPGFPVVCEGRVHTPADARAAIEAGAWAVVVGTAITHPTSITSWFADALR